jgi:hypothetical protein
MSRTYRDRRKYDEKHVRWICAYEPGRNYWTKPGSRPWWKFWMNIPDRAYTRTTRHKAKEALRRGDYQHVSLFIRRRYNSYGRDE